MLRRLLSLSSSRSLLQSNPIVRRPLALRTPASAFFSTSPVTKMPLVTIASNIAEGLKKHEVVPEVIDEFDPLGLITVTYGSETEVTMGNTLKPAETQNIPRVSLTFSDEKQFSQDDTYTLIMTDPDAPTKGDKKWSEYCHYIVSGIKPPKEGTSVAEINLNEATTIIPYMGPAPPPKTGKHRYVFLLLKEQPGKLPVGLGGTSNDVRPTWGTNIPGSGVKSWAEKNALTPVAINFFYAQNPEQ